MTTAEVLALFDDDPQPSVLTRQSLYVPGESRGGKAAGREREGGIIVHRPTVAILLPSDFPPLSHRRPDFADLRHVLVRFGFMVDRLAPRRSYVSATITITLDHPDAVVRAQRPSLVTVDSELLRLHHHRVLRRARQHGQARGPADPGQGDEAPDEQAAGGHRREPGAEGLRLALPGTGRSAALSPCSGRPGHHRTAPRRFRADGQDRRERGHPGAKAGRLHDDDGHPLGRADPVPARSRRGLQS